MKIPDINTILSDLGLSNEEIKIYLVSLELGPQPASVLAKKAGLKRGQTYNKLSLLRQKGIMQEFIENKVSYFTSLPPNTLLSVVDRRREELDVQKQKLFGVIPFLEKIKNPLLIQPKVRFFQGVEGLKEIYEDTIRVKNQSIYAFGDFNYFFPEDQDEALNKWIWDYSNKRADRGITYVGIINKSNYSDQAYKKRVRQKRKLKMLKDVYLPAEINVYGDKVAVSSTYKDMVGLIIEDAPIAETLRNLHQAVWKYLPDYKI
jgi:HTH-type transcriptional regulator, sugar sensing transcriptional regulator